MQNVWPDGTYSLREAPHPYKCPSETNPVWRTGFVFQDAFGPIESRDNNLEKEHCSHDLKTYYCSKTVTTGDTGRPWPKGSYCIRKKTKCPVGFTDHSVFWDDEDFTSKSSIEGTVPDGVYNRNTLIYYCCRSDAHPTNAIYLPTRMAFYLIRNHQDGCQKVDGMKVTEDILLINSGMASTQPKNEGEGPYLTVKDIQDCNFNPGQELSIHYCLYKPD